MSKSSSKKETKISTTTTEKRMGLTLFLQNNPQNPGIEAILKKLYSGEVMTTSEWLNKIDEILGKKIKS